MQPIPSILICCLVTLTQLLRAQEKPKTQSDALMSATEIPFEKADEFPDIAYALVAKAQVVWLGEMHGTNEAPLLLLGLVRLVSRNNLPPVVALEIPARDQSAIDDYIRTGNESILKTRTFFNAAVKDGRSSQAMAKLLSTLRSEKITSVVCFDPFPVKTAQERDEKMAQILARCVEKSPGTKVVVLSGNVHSRITEGTSWDPTYRPAAFELGKQIARVATFNLRYEGGTIWAHMENGVGEHEVTGSRWEGGSQYYISFDSTPTRGHHGVIFSRTVSASPPLL